MTESLSATTRLRKPLGHTVWFKIVLGALFFAPAVVATGYDQAETTQLIATVLADPLTLRVPLLLPLTKLLLLVIAVIPFAIRQDTTRVVLGYYAIALLVVGFLQNMAVTERYGFAWLLGNTLVQLVVAGWCIADIVTGRSAIVRARMDSTKLWVLLPMAVAFVFPYNFDSIGTVGVVRPELGLSVLYNDAGLTYCMITPVVLGILIVFWRGVDGGLLSVVSFVGAGFGLFNLVSWFALQPQNWWMGVLHLPLVTLAVYGLVLARRLRHLHDPHTRDVSAVV